MRLGGYDAWCVDEELKGGGHGLFAMVVLSLYSSGETEEDRTSRPGYSVSRSRFEPGISRILVQNVVTTPRRSVPCLSSLGLPMCDVTSPLQVKRCGCSCFNVQRTDKYHDSKYVFRVFPLAFKVRDRRSTWRRIEECVDITVKGWLYFDVKWLRHSGSFFPVKIIPFRIHIFFKCVLCLDLFLIVDASRLAG
jgi:hypothetical protein